MPLSTVVFLLLIGSLATVWVHRIVTIVLFVLTLIAALYSGHLGWDGLLFVALLTGAIFTLQFAKGRGLRWCLFLFIGGLSITMILHFIPGFHNLFLGERISFSSLSMPYTFYANLDKGIAGWLVLVLAGGWRSSWRVFRRPSYWMWVGGAIACLMVLSLLIGAVKVDPKLSPWLPLWSVIMLFLVCVPEEAIFRGFLQERLTQLIGNPTVALGIVTILFSLIHYRQGPIMMALAAVGGLFYGIVYNRYRSLEASIFLHFSVNLVHFLFFTYPFAAVR